MNLEAGFRRLALTISIVGVVFGLVVTGYDTYKTVLHVKFNKDSQDCFEKAAINFSLRHVSTLMTYAVIAASAFCQHVSIAPSNHGTMLIGFHFGPKVAISLMPSPYSL